MESFIFDSWAATRRTLLVGVLAYIGLVLLLRIFGKRTLAKMNAFDFVVTVALGSTLASILLNKEVALTQGVLAFAVLTGMQFLISWTSTRASWLRKVITGEPALLLHQGTPLQATLRRTRVTEEELRAALRAGGCSTYAEAEAVVLETDGSFSVVKSNATGGPSSLGDTQHSGPTG